MGLTKHKLGKYIELINVRNVDLKYGIEDVRGVNNLKLLMPTKADISRRDLTKFQIVAPGEFVFNHRTSRNGSKFSVAYNDTNASVICTEDYVVFRIKTDFKSILIAEWLYLFFNRPEFDRYVIMNSWGSSTEFYNWEDICDIDIALPAFDIQQKYVAIYDAMISNQRSFERGLEDLKLVCDGFIDQLRRASILEPIGQYLMLSDIRNELGLGVESVKGLSVSKEMIATKADINGVNLDNYKIVPPKYIAYVPDTSRRGDKMSLGYNNTNETFLVSSISIVFGTKQEKLLPEYLMLFFCRSEFDRYARFHSWGSARETFDWSEMCEVRIPIPDIKVQQSIVNIYNAYIERKAINDKLKEQIKNICPILIKGSLEEAGGKDE